MCNNFEITALWERALQGLNALPPITISDTSLRDAIMSDIHDLNDMGKSMYRGSKKQPFIHNKDSGSGGPAPSSTSAPLQHNNMERVTLPQG